MQFFYYTSHSTSLSEVYDAFKVISGLHLDPFSDKAPVSEKGRRILAKGMTW